MRIVGRAHLHFKIMLHAQSVEDVEAVQALQDPASAHAGAGDGQRLGPGLRTAQIFGVVEHVVRIFPLSGELRWGGCDKES